MSGCAGRADGGVLRFEAMLGGRPVADSTPNDPIELHHEEITEVILLIDNPTEAPVTVAHVRFEGELLDLIFLSYDTGINETIQPGEQRVIRFPIDFFDLNGQAHGLLRTELRLFDGDRNPLGSQELFVDGRGSVLATMAVFNLVLAAVAIASFGWNLFRLAQRNLPAGPVARGVRFVHSGLAFGLAFSAAFSTLRIWPLPTYAWVLITLVSALGGFAAGYFSPGADEIATMPVINLTNDRGESIHISTP